MDAIQKTTSLWELLNNNNGVLVPVFQRDYAQGRAEKIDLRKKFLEEIKEGLRSGNGLLLDFVYGAKTADGKIAPLDGQQRLTTIWLLMWYSLYCGYSVSKDKELIKKLAILKKFSYETRPSSTAFIKWLCGDELFPDNKQNGQNDSNKTVEQVSLSSYIQSLKGFNLLWKQDPTIQSMLRMLSGTYKKDGTSNEDGIEHIFKPLLHPLYHTNTMLYLNKLFNKNSPVKFYYLDLDGIKQSDKLYVKMNARGEQLTGFENFKADLVGFLSKNDSLKKYTNIKDDYILKKWDVDWNDKFWEHINLKAKNGEVCEFRPIDDIFFSFIKRFLLNEYIVNNKSAGKDDKVRALLYEGEQNEYTSFDTYKDLFNKKTIDKLIKVLDNAETINDSIIKGNLPLLKNKDYSFFPKYQGDKRNGKPVVASLALQERVMMYGICQFLSCHKVYDQKVSFLHWLRVLANLVYYNEIASFDEFENRIKFIDAVTKKLIGESRFQDIYNINSQVNVGLGSFGNNSTQLVQENKKIELIKTNENIEDKLKQLEALWLFEGNIDFIFDKDGNIILSNLDECANILICIDGPHKKVGDCTDLTKLFQAIIAKWKEPTGDFELLINDEHNNLRKILNNEFKEAFVEVLNDCIKNSIKFDEVLNDCIKNSINNNTPSWKDGLIKGDALWKYTDNGKIVKDNTEYYLRKRKYKNEADINLNIYAEFINNNFNNAHVQNISYKENSTWTVTVKFKNQEETYKQ